jgi:hypothetical protein
MKLLTPIRKAVQFVFPDKKKFVFGIPLIGSHLSDNFEEICKLLNHTVNSCLRQIDGHYSILIACNEIPDPAIVTQSNKIRYIVTQRISRSTLETKPRADVWLKRNALKQAAVALGARYYFQLDADDLVSNKLVAFVRSVDNPNGYIMGSGYLLDSRTQFLYPVPHPRLPRPTFDQFCGSTIIATLDPSPTSESKQKNLRYLEEVISPGHDLARTSFSKAKRMPHIIDFPSAIYRANHGSNLYLRLNTAERTDYIDMVASVCMPLDGVQLDSVRQEFAFKEE